MAPALAALSLLLSTSSALLVPRVPPRLPSRAVVPLAPALLPLVSPRTSLASLMLSATPPPEPFLVKESPLRSFVKAAGWRFTAGIVTACSSYFFTGSLAMAASIVGWDLFSKSGTMFIGERLWNKVSWGKTKTGDTSQRSLAKAIAWRIFAACNTLFAAAVLTKGKTGVASKIAGSDSVIKTVLFFFYERAWSLVAWGKQTADEVEEQ